MRYNRIKQLGKDKFQEYANQVFSIAQMLKKLGYSNKAGGSYHVVKKYLQEYQIDTSHWTGQAWNKGQQLKDWSQYNSYKINDRKNKNPDDIKEMPKHSKQREAPKNMRC